MTLFFALIALALMCVACARVGYNNGYEDGKTDEEWATNYRDNDEIHELRGQVNRLLSKNNQLKKEIDDIKEEYELMRGAMLDSMVSFESVLKGDS